jgi:hypothetical protein
MRAAAHGDDETARAPRPAAHPEGRCPSSARPSGTSAEGFRQSFRKLIGSLPEGRASATHRRTGSDAVKHFRKEGDVASYEMLPYAHAMAKDTYTSAQAARILGVSERRVRQLVSEEKLSGSRGDDGIVRISQRSVNEERKRRQGTTRSRKASAGTAKRAGRGSAASPGVDVDQLAEKLASAVGQRLEGQIEISRRAESLVRQELDEERARRMEVEAKLADAERRASELAGRNEELTTEIEEQRARKRGLFRR